MLNLIISSSIHATLIGICASRDNIKEVEALFITMQVLAIILIFIEQAKFSKIEYVIIIFRLISFILSLVMTIVYYTKYNDNDNDNVFGILLIISTIINFIGLCINIYKSKISEETVDNIDTIVDISTIAIT